MGIQVHSSSLKLKRIVLKRTPLNEERSGTFWGYDGITEFIVAVAIV